MWDESLQDSLLKPNVLWWKCNTAFGASLSQMDKVVGPGSLNPLFMDMIFVEKAHGYAIILGSI